MVLLQTRLVFLKFRVSSGMFVVLVHHVEPGDVARLSILVVHSLNCV